MVFNRSLSFLHQCSARGLHSGSKLPKNLNPTKTLPGLPKKNSSLGTSILAFLTITSPYVVVSFTFYNSGSISSLSPSEQIWLCFQP
ncbi:hypothetical protein CL657_00795 [bacterium]|nr:hypothetical protein [bacterium]